MPSQDVLDRLFAIEHEAEDLVAEARAESERRIAAAKERSRLIAAAAMESAAAAAAAQRSASAAAAEAEYKSAIEAYRREIESLPVDDAFFRLACERALTERP
jgi:vacuolar-type H+-ATPase subunit H